jgi:hypothetical protein
MSETTPAAPAAEPIETTIVPTPAAPSPTSAPETATPLKQADFAAPETDEEGLGLGDVEGEEPAEQGEEPQQAEDRAPLKPWTPPEGQEILEVAKEPLADLDAIFADNKKTAEEKRDGTIEVYNKMMAAQVARIDALNAATKSETVAALKAEHGGNLKGYLSEVDAAFNELPAEFRDAIKAARLPDGRLLVNLPETARMIHRMGQKPAPAPSPEGRRLTIQRELAEIDTEMNKDASSLYKPWKATGQLATDYKLALLRELNGEGPKRASPTALKTEEAELMAFWKRDPQLFEYRKDWRGTNKSGAERLAEIRQGRA